MPLSTAEFDYVRTLLRQSAAIDLDPDKAYRAETSLLPLAREQGCATVNELSEAVLERARRGVYTQLEVNRGLPAALLAKYFTRQGLDWRLSDDVRGMVEFGTVNLIKGWPVAGPLDVVFLRNVLIYFD